MSLFKNNSDLLDEAVHQVADEPIDPRQVEDAAARVWARLSQEGAALQRRSGHRSGGRRSAAGSLHGCDDFQSLIPAYVRGELSPARALLVEDHTRSCVPCRRALREAREGRVAAAASRCRCPAAEPGGLDGPGRRPGAGDRPRLRPGDAGPGDAGRRHQDGPHRVGRGDPLPRGRRFQPARSAPARRSTRGRRSAPPRARPPWCAWPTAR